MAWIWGCNWNNNASDWKDSERCLAGARKPYKTEKAAKVAARAHGQRKGHQGYTFVKKIHGNVKL